MPFIPIIAPFFFYMISRPFANALPTANIDGIDQQPKPYFSSVCNNISPAAQIAPPPHIVAMGNEIGCRQSPGHKLVAQAARAKP
jgi:hypothetical protein